MQWEQLFPVHWVTGNAFQTTGEISSIVEERFAFLLGELRGENKAGLGGKKKPNKPPVIEMPKGPERLVETAFQSL